MTSNDPHIPSYVQRALDDVREDLLELKANLGPEGYWHGQPDIEDRVENWQFNTWRRMEDILTQGEVQDAKDD